MSPCAAYGDRFIVPDYDAYGYYGAPYRSDDALELARIRRELRDQRRLDNERARRQEQEINLLRQQTMTDHQISAQQACYYRSTGGFELCADLFAPDSAAFADCEGRVIQRQPVVQRGAAERAGYPARHRVEPRERIRFRISRSSVHAD
tara:strand:- start:1813 stop:2259 length:447 start_codon:yes stop_codon:yes gene_type:complete